MTKTLLLLYLARLLLDDASYCRRRLMTKKSAINYWPAAFKYTFARKNGLMSMG
jgi:hypothetical protein